MFQQKNTQKRMFVLTAVIVVILAAVVVFLALNSTQKSTEHIGYAMGSEITVIFYGDDKKDLADEIFDSIADLDKKLISRKLCNTSQDPCSRLQRFLTNSSDLHLKKWI